MSTFAIVGAAMCATAAAVSDRNSVHATPAADVEAIEIGLDTYVYGYPLVRMEMTRRVMTNVASADELRAPMGQFANMRTYPTPAYHDVAAPNADTLCSSAWLDLSKEPYVLSIPDMLGRYYLVPIERRVDERVRIPGQARDGNGAAEIRDHRPRLERRAAGGCHAVQVADQHRVGPRAHLFERDAV